MGTFETKYEELSVLSQLLQAQGLNVLEIDLSFLAEGAILNGEEKIQRMTQIAKDATAKVKNANPGAVLAIGGGTGSEMALSVLQPLPIAMPKFLITTLPFDPRRAVSDNAVTLIPTLCDIQGMNAVLRRVFTRTAAMVAAVVGSFNEPDCDTLSVAVSLLGVTHSAGEEVLKQLKINGQETSSFHAAGYGGAALTRFAQNNMFCGVIDLTVNEIVRMHIAGPHVPMPDRFTCTAHLPRVVLPGALNLFDCGSYEGMSQELRDRAHYQYSSYFTHVKLSHAEIAQATQALTSDLNRSTAHCEVLLPMHGFSSEDRPGGAIEDADLREHAAEIFENNAREYTVTRLPQHINSLETASEAVSRLLPHLKVKA